MIKRAWTILSDEGLFTFMNKCKNYLTKKILSDVLYRKFHPEHITLSIDDKTAQFHTGMANQEYDFLSDFNHEKQIIQKFINDLTTDDVVYDIGANVGLYSVFSGKILNDGQIIAIEPQPAAVPILYKNLLLNCKDFKIFQIGASNRSGFGKIQVTPSSDADIDAKSGVNIPLNKISNLANSPSLPDPTVAKIDVEGAEREVLEGFDSFLNDLDLLYIEVHHEKLENFQSGEFDIRKNLQKTFENVITLGEMKRETTVTHLKAVDR